MTEFTAASNADIMRLVGALKPGDTLLLAAGNYAAVEIRTRWAAPGVVIRPAPGAQVEIAGVTVNNGAGITFVGLKSVTDRVGFMIGGPRPERVHVIDCEAHGNLNDDITKKGGVGIAFATASDCSAVGNNIHHFAGGFRYGASSNVRIADNYIHDCRGDAMGGGGVKGLVIEGNLITDLYPAPPDHCDGIQIFSAGLPQPCTDVVIRRNRLFRGKGRYYQGIFANNEARIPYRNVLIEENVVMSDHWHGITFVLAEGLTIRNNYVGVHDGAYGDAWIKVQDCAPDTVIENNLTSGAVIVVPPAKATLRNNKPLKKAKKGDDTAAQAWWSKLPPRAALPGVPGQPLLAMAGLAAIAHCNFGGEDTRREALAKLGAQAGRLFARL